LLKQAGKLLHALTSWQTTSRNFRTGRPAATAQAGRLLTYGGRKIRDRQDGGSYLPPAAEQCCGFITINNTLSIFLLWLVLSPVKQKPFLKSDTTV
jgi:hypothetical protein